MRSYTNRIILRRCARRNYEVILTMLCLQGLRVYVGVSNCLPVGLCLLIIADKIFLGIKEDKINFGENYCGGGNALEKD